jgi:hypothetical protein
MIGNRRSTSVLRSKKASERPRKTRPHLHSRLSVLEQTQLKKPESSFADEIKALCGQDFSGTADRIAASAAVGSVEKVISAESYLKDAAISLAQGEKLSALLAELRDVADALGMCQEGGRVVRSENRSAGLEEMRPALPGWWFALSEMLQVCEREIEFVTSIGRGQRKNEPARQLCNLVVRVLRKHYQEALGEAEDWIDMSND